MAKVEMLRAFVNQRLTAAADEIFQLFERTIAEYEEKLEFSSKENNRQRKLLAAVYNPEVRLHRAEIQQLSVVRNEVPSEKQEWSSSLDQKDPEPPHIKEEQEEVWTSQEREQFSLPAVTVKSEEERAQSSQLLTNTKTEEDSETTETDVEDCGGSEVASPLKPAIHDKAAHSERETGDRGDWEGMEEFQSGLNPLEYIEVTLSDDECRNEKTVSSSERAKNFVPEGHLQKITRYKAGRRPYNCSVCGKQLFHKWSLTVHMRVHSEEKSFKCSVCETRFSTQHNLVTHLRTHTGEKPFKCSVCSRAFAQSGTLRRHMSIHSKKKPHCCSICSKTFSDHNTLRWHFARHTGEKPFSCSVCSKTFASHSKLKRHLTVHTGAKRFSCSFCSHTFAHHSALRQHLARHTLEKANGCSICNKRFSKLDALTEHKCAGESSGEAC